MLKQKLIYFSISSGEKRVLTIVIGSLTILIFLLLNTFYTEKERLGFRNQFTNFIYSFKVTRVTRNYQCDKVYWEQKIAEIKTENEKMFIEHQQNYEKCISGGKNKYDCIGDTPWGEEKTVPTIPTVQSEEVTETTKIFGITVKTTIKSPDTYKDKSNCEIVSK